MRTTAVKCISKLHSAFKFETLNRKKTTNQILWWSSFNPDASGDWSVSITWIWTVCCGQKWITNLKIEKLCWQNGSIQYDFTCTCKQVFILYMNIISIAFIVVVCLSDPSLYFIIIWNGIDQYFSCLTTTS